jgi:hypothetical protein
MMVLAEGKVALQPRGNNVSSRARGLGAAFFPGSGRLRHASLSLNYSFKHMI